jgi:hypothetical protein
VLTLRRYTPNSGAAYHLCDETGNWPKTKFSMRDVAPNERDKMSAELIPPHYR